MAVPVIMPRQGQSVESCIIGEWHVSKGDKVSAGDKLFTYETDKATFDEEAPEDGEVIAVFFEEGDDVPCLLNVLVIGEADEAWEEFIPEGATVDGAGAVGTAETEEETVQVEETAPAAAPTEVTDQVATPSLDGDHPVSPRAKGFAAKHNVDLRMAGATGPKGRIIERDVVAALDAGYTATTAAAHDYAAGVSGSGIAGAVRVEDLAKLPELQSAEGAAYIDSVAGALDEPEYVDSKLSNIRKVISRTMHKSLSELAQLTFNTPVDATNLLAWRNRLKELKAQGMAEQLGLPLLENIPTINDIFLYAVSRTVKKFPDFNAHFLEEEGTVRHYNRVHLGVAVDTERGLMVPVIKNADLKSLAQISAEAKKLAQECQTGSISPDKLAGGTITVTNMGVTGVENFTPVINPPETCIVGVNSATEKVRSTPDGGIEIYPAIYISLTTDHRAVDGAPSGQFSRALKQTLENFDLFLMD